MYERKWLTQIKNYPYDTQSATFTLASLENNKNLVRLTTETYNQLNDLDYDVTSASKTETKLS